MHRLPLCLAIAAITAAFSTADRADATTLPYFATVTIQVDLPDPLAFNPSVFFTGTTGTATVTGGPSGSLSLPASMFGITGQIATPLFPFSGVPQIELSAHNPSGGVFSGTPLGGSMALAGVAKLCLFAACGAASSVPFSIPLSVVGISASATKSTGTHQYTVKGAPWIASTVTVFDTHGGHPIFGFQTPPASPLTPGGVIQLATPFYISTNLPSAPEFGGAVRIQVLFSPEPATLGLLGLGVVGLAVMRRSRTGT